MQNSREMMNLLPETEKSIQLLHRLKGQVDLVFKQISLLNAGFRPVDKFHQYLKNDNCSSLNSKIVSIETNQEQAKELPLETLPTQQIVTNGDSSFRAEYEQFDRTYQQWKTKYRLFCREKISKTKDELYDTLYDLFEILVIAKSNEIQIKVEEDQEDSIEDLSEQFWSPAAAADNDDYCSDVEEGDDKQEQDPGQSFSDPNVRPRKRGRPRSAIKKTKQIIPVDPASLVCNVGGCQFVAKRIASLFNHRKAHDDERPFKCLFLNCGFAAKRECHLKLHMRFHQRGDQPFKCQFEGCNYGTRNSTTFKKHHATHSDDRPFKCDVDGCGFAGKLSCHLRDHKISIHSDERRYKCEAEGCNYASKQKKNLKVHFQLIHCEDRPFQCQFCEFSAKTKSILKLHQMTHNKKPNFVCEVCGYEMRSRSTYNTHMLKHKAGGLIRCSQGGCSYSTVNRGNMKQHEERKHHLKHSYRYEELSRARRKAKTTPVKKQKSKRISKKLDSDTEEEDTEDDEEVELDDEEEEEEEMEEDEEIEYEEGEQESIETDKGSNTNRVAVEEESIETDKVLSNEVEEIECLSLEPESGIQQDQSIEQITELAMSFSKTESAQSEFTQCSPNLDQIEHRF